METVRFNKARRLKYAPSSSTTHSAPPKGQISARHQLQNFSDSRRAPGSPYPTNLQKSHGEAHLYPKYCSNCNRPGHINRDCTNSPKSGLVNEIEAGIENGEDEDLEETWGHDLELEAGKELA
ncbi:hypothetical protein K3495_g9239 [Podosphaera aphanis]|nr:hypothetical protein K3495_g9239 [Podosphaera aphanis]